MWAVCAWPCNVTNINRILESLSPRQSLMCWLKFYSAPPSVSSLPPSVLKFILLTKGGRAFLCAPRGSDDAFWALSRARGHWGYMKNSNPARLATRGPYRWRHGPWFAHSCSPGPRSNLSFLKRAPDLGEKCHRELEQGIFWTKGDVIYPYTQFFFNSGLLWTWNGSYAVF